MTDRELLEMAAKAAGIEVAWVDEFGVMRQQDYGFNNGARWNPFTDDGDALRLAVKLRIKFRYNEALGQALAWMGPEPGISVNIEDCGRDEYACARRAIVRAAAEIGRQMP